ncbi:MAG: CoA-binding protein [Deltaproteobacteria bacterium]|nr:CoA-binding protein [Deltaproteobacteria bacterium]
MNSKQELIAQIDSLYHPKSVAIIGLPRGLKTGKLFLLALLDQKFPGEIYAVHPSATEIDGIKAYKRVSDIPGPVDLAIVLVPHQHALSVVKDCADKGVKGAILFTAGYKETGTEEGIALESELVRVARSSGMRLIGPNGMGLYSPKSGLSFFPQLSRESGGVGLISHSGSLSNMLGRMGSDLGFGFSKAVSLGNECDLSTADFLIYLGNDPETKLIAVYLEGIRDGRYFINALKEASLKKPVIIWKMGLTPEGSAASASHTGGLATSKDMWRGVVQQTGVIQVTGFEQWADAIMCFSMLPVNIGNRLAIISGPGGLAVSATEACGREGLSMAKMASETRSALAEFVPPTGTSLKNPIDVGMSASLEIDIYIQAAKIVAADPGVDTIVMIGVGMDEITNQQYTEAIIQMKNDFNKPFVIVKIPGFDAKLVKDILDAGIPVFDSAERALHTYASAYRYYDWRRNISR